MSSGRSIKGNTHRRGSVVYQVTQLLTSLEAFGHSRHEAKQRTRQAGLGTPSGIHAHATLEDYLDINIHMVKWWRQEYGLRSVAEITQDMVDAYFARRLGVSAWTWDKELAAFHKLQRAMELHGVGEPLRTPSGWRRRLGARNPMRFVSYSAEEVQDLLAALPMPYCLMAWVQWETGGRWVALQQLYVENLGPGQLLIGNKGGKKRWRPISRALNHALVEWTAQVPKGTRMFQRSYSAYYRALAKTYQRLGLENGGTHALRRSFSERRIKELMALGLTEAEARRQVGKELGHGDKRGKVTLSYSPRIED